MVPVCFILAHIPRSPCDAVRLRRLHQPPSRDRRRRGGAPRRRAPPPATQPTRTLLTEHPPVQDAVCDFVCDLARGSERRAALRGEKPGVADVLHCVRKEPRYHYRGRELVILKKEIEADKRSGETLVQVRRGGFWGVRCARVVVGDAERGG